MNKKQIYIEKLEEVGKYSVWLVDGEYIRKDINENFVEYDEHYHLPFIPKNELWIDKASNPKEHFFFIDHMINEQWEIEKGMTYEAAMEKADAIEKKERAKICRLEEGGAENRLRSLLRKFARSY